jgi:peroxiredoxin
MRNFGIKFIISCVFGLAGIGFLIMDLHLSAAIAFILAFFANVGEVKEYGSMYQNINFHINTLLLGYSIDILCGNGTYWYTLCMFFMPLMGVLRLELFKILMVNRHNWIELVGTIAVWGLYVFAGLQHPGDWRGWVLPVLPILFKTYIGLNIFLDKNKNYKEHEEDDNTVLGKKAPPFSLQDIAGRNVSLSDFENKNHILLIFVRGDWCPTCHIMIRAYETNIDKFKEKNIVPIGISPDTNEVNKAMMERLGWKNMLLTDDKQEVASRYGLLFKGNSIETSYEQGVVLPASFLIDKNGVLRYMSRSDRAGEFLSPSLIFPVIDNLS